MVKWYFRFVVDVAAETGLALKCLHLRCSEGKWSKCSFTYSEIFDLEFWRDPGGSFAAEEPPEVSDIIEGLRLGAAASLSSTSSPPSDCSISTQFSPSFFIFTQKIGLQHNRRHTENKYQKAKTPLCCAVFTYNFCFDWLVWFDLCITVLANF